MGVLGILSPGTSHDKQSQSKNLEKSLSALTDNDNNNIFSYHYYYYHYDNHDECSTKGFTMAARGKRVSDRTFLRVL